MKRNHLFRVLTIMAAVSASLMLSCTKSENLTEDDKTVEEDKTVEPFPIKVIPASLDTIMDSSTELFYEFKIECYDIDKVQMNTEGLAHYMHAQFTLNRRDKTLQIWSQRRVGNLGRCSVRLNDDQSEVTVNITVRTPD